MAGRWRYFLTDPELVDEGLTNVFRLGEGAPLLTLEMANGSGGWRTTDRMWRVHYLGSDDVDFHEVSAARAREVLDRMLELGEISRVSDLDAPGPDADTVAAARTADDRADAVWRDVPTPPGVEDLNL